MKHTTLICAGSLLALFIATKFLGGKSLDRIKARTVGHGQHGAACWATRREIRSYYTMVPYEPQKWRAESLAERTAADEGNRDCDRLRKGTGRKQTINLSPGFVLGTFRHGLHGKHITAWVDAGDSHAMMIASPGGGKTAYFLYPNIEYAMA